eukprot:356953-Chlamydomonas_euryale.AAC.2
MGSVSVMFLVSGLTDLLSPLAHPAATRRAVRCVVRVEALQAPMRVASSGHPRARAGPASSSPG